MRLQALAAAALLGAGLAAAQVLPVNAAEGGASFYLLGSRGPMAGFTPPPGLYFQNDTYFYTGDASVRMPLAGKLVADVEADLIVNLATALWVSQADVLGGRLALTATVPFGGPSISARLDPTPIGVSDDTFTFGDPVLGGFVGWRDGNLHWQTGVSLNIPVGNYRDGELANMSFNHFAADFYASATWLDQATGLEFSGVAGVTLNAEDPATDYRNGTELHLELAAVQHFSPTFDLGLVGYWYQQVTPDTGAGVPSALDGFEGRVAAIGVTAGYNFKVAEVPVMTRVKYFHEFAARNRLEGDSAFLTVTIPLGAPRG